MNYNKSFNGKIPSYETIENSDQIRVLSFGYTNEKSILAGPITPLWWFEQTIQYLIKNSIPRNKIIMSVNTLCYKWAERDFAVLHRDNFVLEEIQAQTVKKNSIDRISGKTSSERSDSDTIFQYNEDAFEVTALCPTEDYIETLTNLSADYGLKGVQFVQ